MFFGFLTVKTEHLYGLCTDPKFGSLDCLISHELCFHNYSKDDIGEFLHLIARSCYRKTSLSVLSLAPSYVLTGLYTVIYLTILHLLLAVCGGHDSAVSYSHDWYCLLNRMLTR